MKKIILAVLIMNVFLCHAQQNIKQIEQQFNTLAIEQKGLDENVISEVTGLNLYTLISTIALEHKLNVDVDPKLTTIVESNYFDVPVKEVFSFLIQKHDLEVDFINKFIVFKKKKPVVVPLKKEVIKKIDVSYRNENGFLSVNLKNDSLPRVAEMITKQSGKNIIISPKLKTTKVTGYFQNRPFDDILNMIGQSNGIVVVKNENGSYLMELDETPKETKQQNSRNPKNRKNNRGSSQGKGGEQGFFDVKISDTGFLNINAYKSSVADIIMDAAEKLKLNYYLYSVPTDIETTLVANQITFDDLLKTVFKGKDFTYSTDDSGFYFIGKRDEEGLRATELIQLENRTIETVLASIPAELKKDLDVKEFPELNGLVVSGSKIKIDELRNYTYLIDKVVPMVQLEVIIVQYNKSHDVQTGMKAGLDSQARTTSGVLFPTTDVQMNAQSVNGLIDMFNGLVGGFNLGKVTEQFYLNLKFLENNSIVKVESKPKIATLSGHDATLTIGEQRYYFEQRNNIVPIGNTNQNQLSGTWKPINADLSVNIKPFVSKDEQITLQLTVSKNAFSGSAGENAPPNTITQSFDSFIRIKNNEMVLLGGLDELTKENSGTGVPLISRIPVLKWFFSGRSKRKSKSQLHIFIKPTVTY